MKKKMFYKLLKKNICGNVDDDYIIVQNKFALVSTVNACY